MSYYEHDMLPFLLRFLIFTDTQDLFKSESFIQQVNFVNASKVIKLFHSISLKIKTNFPTLSSYQARYL
jgi:hypothetical protein